MYEPTKIDMSSELPAISETSQLTTGGPLWWRRLWETDENFGAFKNPPAKVFYNIDRTMRALIGQKPMFDIITV